MTLTCHVENFRTGGVPSNFWLRDGVDIPAIFSVVDPDATVWSWAAFVGDEVIRGRAPLAEVLAVALDAAGIDDPDRTRLLAEFPDL